jgi:F420-dependent oxidoreductase-like protein
MRTATTVEGSNQGSWRETLDFVLEAEKLGLDICWVAEAWGSDAPSTLGFLAARTERLLLGSGIIQVGIRTPVAIAQAALTLAEMSEGRFLLGLGPSGPQVIEGLHGVPFAKPLTRVRETVEIIRQAFTGEKVSYAGKSLQVPLPGGDGKPMRLSMTPNPDIPIYLATMSPKLLELTGEIADGWLGTSFVPEGSAAYFDHLDAGLAASGRGRGDLDVCQGAEVAFAADEDELRGMVTTRKKGLAFSLGGMGSATTNFYNNAYSRQGWADVAAAVRERWQGGDRDGAAELVTDEMVLGTTLIGTEEMVRTRLGVWRDAGVDTVRLYPAGDTLDTRLSTLGRALDLVREIS